MQSLGFESKNPTIYNMIADLESEGREISFDDFLDAITSKLGDKETKVKILLHRWELTESLNFLMMTGRDLLMSTTFEELQRNWVRL